MSVFEIVSDSASGVFIAYKSNETTLPNSGGYGDGIVSAKLKQETNKAPGLDFMLLPQNQTYDTYQKMKTLVYVKRDNKYIFRGRVTDVKTDIFKQRSITCEGDLAFLSDSVQPPNKVTVSESAGGGKTKRVTYYNGTRNKDALKMTVEAYFRSIIAEHNAQMTESVKQFTVGQITVSCKNDQETFERTSYQDTSSLISSELLSVYGGIIRTRYVNDVAYIDWLEEYTETNTQKIRFGVNLLELDEEPPCDEVWSVLLPIGDDNLTISSVNSNSIYLENQTAITKYGRIVHYHKFTNVDKAADLKTKAQRYLASHSKVFPENLVVTAIDLQLIGQSDDPIEIGDLINVVSSPHNINKTMACIEMELDIPNPENNSYTIGTIMPPDKEKKKETLSSQQSSTRSSVAWTALASSLYSDSLQQDINTTASNVNVNAENISVNAQNIAVNAENLAVVAQNLTIAAETIDLTAQELTATFEDESGDLSALITASAAEIKTEMQDQASGVISQISVSAGAISTSVSNAEGTISSKITQTQNAIILDFNKKLYGENQDGTGGIYADYVSKISASATSLTSTFDQKLYGQGGTLENPTQGSLVADYVSKISQTATNIRTEVSTTLYGQGGTDANPVSGSIKSLINQNAYAITLRVEKGDIASSINQTAQSVRIQASKIDLDGYATVTSLNATNTNITRLTTGQDTASTIQVNNFYVQRTTQDGTVYNKFSPNVVYLNQSSLLTASGYILGTQSLDLSHSHSVTVGNDGTVTLGGAASSGGSFRIADTKTYKDGVSAAIASVSVTGITDSGWVANSDYLDARLNVSLGVGGVTDHTQSNVNARINTQARYNAGKAAGIRAAGVASISCTNPAMATGSDYLDAVLSVGIGEGSTVDHSVSKTVRINTQARYNAGKAAGIRAAGVASISCTNPEMAIGSDYLDAVLSVGIGEGSTVDHSVSKTVRINTQARYNAGFNAVRVTSVGLLDGTAPAYDSLGGTHRYTLRLNAEASNEYAKEGTYSFVATDAYNEGVGDGRGQVRVISISCTNPAPASGDRYVDTSIYTSLGVDQVQFYANTYTVRVNTQAEYDAGRSSVTYSDVTIDTVTINRSGTVGVKLKVLNGYYHTITVAADKLTDNRPK